MRPIDADALNVVIENAKKDMEVHGNAIGAILAQNVIEVVSSEVCAPTLDYAPVVHGEWIHDINNLYACSECLMRQTQRMRGRLMNFCPNCGANMMPLPEAPKEE